ncbi:GLPGLI family protein [Chryseobacterium sp. A301]
MKLFSLVFVLFSLLLGAQSRALYEYKFASDSTKQDSIQSEWMYLDINKNGSKYFSKQTFESDSISYASLKKQIESGSKSINIEKKNPGKVDYEVEKTYPDYQVFLNTAVGSDHYRVPEDREMKWEILPEKMQIGEFLAQKATTHFAGRDWTAWFTMEVPIQDGPYKFHGLPGLIVKVEDLSGSHLMELKAFQKQNTDSALGDMELPNGRSIPFISKKKLDITRTQYIKQLQAYQKDPVKGMREMLSRPNTTVSVSFNGSATSNPSEILRSMEKNARDKMKANNNPIELIP